VNNVFEQGLLGTGATITARLLPVAARELWLTNVHHGNRVDVWEKFPATQGWDVTTFSDKGLDRFPYGYVLL